MLMFNPLLIGVVWCKLYRRAEHFVLLQSLQHNLQHFEKSSLGWIFKGAVFVCGDIYGVFANRTLCVDRAGNQPVSVLGCCSESAQHSAYIL